MSSSVMSQRRVSSDLPTAGWVVALSRSLVYALTAAALAWPLAQPTTVQGAAVGAFCGGWLAHVLAQSRLRLPAGLLLWGVASGAAVGLSAWLMDLNVFAQSLGPERLLRLQGAFTWALASAALASAMGFASLRVRMLGVLEVAGVLGACALLVAEHRYGAIHRPFELADPILVRGGDPTMLFLGVGAAAALLMAVVLMHERRLSRLLTHVLLLVLFALGAFAATQRGGVLPHPQPAGAGLGLRGDPKEGKQQGKQSSGRSHSDELEFRDQQPNAHQQTPVAVVLFHDDYSPPTGVYYFRQAAFSQFNGRRLVSSTRDGVDQDVLPGFSPSRQEVRQVPDAGVDRTTLETTVALMADHTRPFGLESLAMVEPAENPNPDRFRRIYRATSVVLTSEYPSLLGLPSGAEDWSDELVDYYTELPDDPRYTQLAQRIVERLPEDLRNDAMLRAWTVRDWLGKEGTYSLRSKHADAEDPTADFLFGDKVGYCVHFAHAATYLMRALGIPARVATGYAVEEAARQGGSALLLTSGAAHAWPEIYLRDVGWVVVDVQPERALDPPVQPPDADLQRLLAQLARGARVLPADGGPPPETFAVLWRWLKARLVWGLLFTTAGLLLLAYLIKLWRAVAPSVAGPASLPRVLYRAELDRLSELGLSRRRGESREAFARRVAGRAPSFQDVTAAHLAAAFGSRRPVEPATLRARARALRDELRRTAPVHRRLLGRLTPWSWWASR